MKIKGKYLQVIARINSDGTSEPSNKDLSKDEWSDYNLTCLSISKKTFIASSGSTYVVKIKPEYIGISEAIKILESHNEWRRFDEEIGDSPVMHNPKEIGLAIDFAINYLKQN